MALSGIIADIDAEIQRLQEARKILQGNLATPRAANKVTRGRPKGSRATAVKTAAPVKAKRKLSPEGRKRIADAMKRRWAERRKTAVKTPAKAVAK